MNVDGKIVKSSKQRKRWMIDDLDNTAGKI